MKKILALLLIAVTASTANAQSPEKINYQAIVRDASGASVVSQLVGVRVAILSTSSVGPEVFAETHTTTSNDYGLINLQIGTGSNSGPALSSIDWGADTYFVKIEIDPAGGTSYAVSSVSQLLSVPYALHAKTAENVDDADADPTNEIQTISKAGSTVTLSDGGGTFTDDVDDADADATNEIQTLSKVGQVVTLSNGGGAFTDDINDADSDPLNETNTALQLTGTTLSLTDADGTLSVDLSTVGGDADSDPTNEIQVMSKAGSIVSLSDGGGSFTDDVNDADADATNELQVLSLAGTNLTLSNGGGTVSVNDADADASNELQTISKAGSTVTLSNSGGSFTDEVDDADNNPNNELISGAILSGTDLEITDAGGTTVVDMSSLVGGGDPSTTNELITGATLTGTNLNITDAGGTTTVDLSSLSGGGSSFRVGQLYQGGVIIYVDTTGNHGVIAALSDLAGTYEFDDSGDGNQLTLLGTDFTNGDVNTAAFVGNASTYPAAEAADALTSGGFSDWYLPSVFELEMMLQANMALGMHGAQLDFTTFYWSSTQDPSAVGFNAYKVRNNTLFIETISESEAHKVRPVRKF